MLFSLIFFSASVPASDSYSFYLEAARRADRAGFYAIWTPERHFDRFGALFPSPAVCSAALATVTERVRLHAGSVVSPLHDVVQIVEEWAVVDNLSRGRVALSFAPGWNPLDFVLRPEKFANRREVMWQQISEARELWRGGLVYRDDGQGRPAALTIFPKPVQSELPLWVTAFGSVGTFRRAGEIGANVLTHLVGQSRGQLRENISQYRQRSLDCGNGPGHVTLMLHSYIRETDTQAWEESKIPFKSYLSSWLELERRATSVDVITSRSLVDEAAVLDAAFLRYSRNGSLIGSFERCKKMVQAMALCGVDELACLLDFGIDPELVLKDFDRLANLKDSCFSVV